MILITAMAATTVAIFALGMLIGYKLQTPVRNHDPLEWSVRRIEHRPGDRFVITTEKDLTREQAARIQEWWKELAGEDARCAVLSGGLKCHIVAVAA